MAPVTFQVIYDLFPFGVIYHDLMTNFLDFPIRGHHNCRGQCHINVVPPFPLASHVILPIHKILVFTGRCIFLIFPAKSLGIFQNRVYLIYLWFSVLCFHSEKPPASPYGRAGI